MRAGIYLILHTISGRCYIGESGQIEVRRSQHRRLLRQRTHPYADMQAAWDADGESAFDFDIIIERMPLSSTREERQRREKFWQRKFRNSLFARGPSRERKPKQSKDFEWPYDVPLITPRRTHLGPPEGTPERRFVKYPGRRDHIVLAAIRAEERALSLHGKSLTSSTQRISSKAKPWRFPIASLPSSSQKTRETIHNEFDRRRLPDRRKS